MKISRLIKYAFGVFGAIATLVGCGGSQINPLGATQGVVESGVDAQALAPPFAQRNGAMVARPDHRRSWMAPEAKLQDLLYVSDLATYDVDVYSYPGGRLKEG